MKDKVRRQQMQLMFYNLIAFSIIFTLFGLILYGQMQSYLLQPVENELYRTRENIANARDYIERQLLFGDAGKHVEGPVQEAAPALPAEEDAPGKPAEGERYQGREPKEVRMLVSMRMQAIVRDEQGKVLNPFMLGHIYYDGYLEQIPVAADAEEQAITSFALENAHYASLTFPLEGPSGEQFTVQLITNVDGERAILHNFTRLLVLCIIVFVLLSLLASYLLSKKTMAPIIRSWNRQTEFVENASHELRTPLTIIQNKMEALLTQPQATVMQKADEIGVSLSETRRLSRLTGDLMTLARADSNETLLEKKPFPLDEMAAQVSEPYAELAELQEKRLLLELGYEGELTADKHRIHELLVILLDNALKFTGEGDTITVRTFQRDGRAVIEVEDTGIGIPEESRARVFDRFFRVDKARGRESGGSGLGLSIAKWIVDAHEGGISVGPGEQGGTLVRVRLKG